MIPRSIEAGGARRTLPGYAPGAAGLALTDASQVAAPFADPFVPCSDFDRYPTKLEWRAMLLIWSISRCRFIVLIQATGAVRANACCMTH
jgi:hypothetical protein